MKLIYDMYSMYENVGSSLIIGSYCTFLWPASRAVVLKKFVVCDKNRSRIFWQQQKMLIANTEMCPNKRT